jgi:hypothetical protein
MNKNSKILLAVLFTIGMSTQILESEHPAFGQSMYDQFPIIDEIGVKEVPGKNKVNFKTPQDATEEPIEIEWQLLMDIEYELKYFEELDMDMYAPLFPQKIKALHEKEVIIVGFVLPFEKEWDVLALSANPFASCFFCGQASPASIISMYLKDKKKRYKMDDFKKFKGTLHLNEDDPDEFYYILRDAEEIKG